jgi:hypothetical protein
MESPKEIAAAPCGEREPPYSLSRRQISAESAAWFSV